MITITRQHVDKINELLNHGLVTGVGNPEPGKMCVEAAICYALGLPHGDDPKCVLPVLRSLKISLNDRNWSSNKARAEGLRRLAIAQLGSDVLDKKDFLTRLARTRLLAIALKCEQEPTEANAREANKTANAADAAAAAAAAADAAAGRDGVLASFAESVVQILIEMKAPGCQWL